MQRNLMLLQNVPYKGSQPLIGQVLIVFSVPYLLDFNLWRGKGQRMQVDTTVQLESVCYVKWNNRNQFGLRNDVEQAKVVRYG